MNSGFLYRGYGYVLEPVEWIEKPGYCDPKWRPCQLCYKTDSGEFACKNNLIGHGCKHVVNGTDAEKTHYSEIMRELEKNGFIPAKIGSEQDYVVQNYKLLSREILKEPASVSIAGDGKNVRVMCEGSGVMDNTVDFLGFERLRIEQPFPFGQQEAVFFGIVSSFFRYSSSDDYVMYRLVHQRYFEHLTKGKNVSPALKCGTDHPEQSVVIPEIDMAFDQAALFYRNKMDEDYSFGAMYYFYWSKCVEACCLKQMYGDIASSIQGYRKPGQLLWNTPNDLNNVLKKKIMHYEHEYSARTMLEYIRYTADAQFTTGLFASKKD